VHCILRGKYFFGGEKREGKGGKCLEKENVFFLEKKEKGDGKGGKYDREGEYFNDGRVDRRKEDTSKVL